MNDFVELRKVLGTALRWWWLLIISLVVGSSIGYLFSQWQTPVYEATATVLVGQSIQSTELDSRDITTSQHLALTYANMARLQPVLQTVVDNLNLEESWQTLKQNVHTAPVEDTQLLRIRVEADSPDLAKSIANEIVFTLIQLSPTHLQANNQDENQTFVLQRLDKLRSDIIEGQQRVDELEEDLLAARTTAGAEQIELELEALESLIIGWESNYTRLLSFVKSKGSPNYLAIAEPAQASPNPIRPRGLLNVIIMGAVGLGLALGGVFLFEYLNDAIKATDNMDLTLGLPVLGTIGQIPGKRYRDKLVTFLDPLAPVSAAYQMLQSNVQFMYMDQGPYAIVVTSPNRAEGKSLTVANMGVTMAQAGFRTILVDTDLRQPVLQRIFRLPERGGVLDFLQKPEIDVRRYLRSTEIANLYVITSGLTPNSVPSATYSSQIQGDEHTLRELAIRHPSQRLVPERIDRLIKGLSKLADVIIFDTPPSLTSADAALVSTQVNGVVMVLKPGQTRMRTAKQAILSLQRLHVSLLGIVLNQSATSVVDYQPGPSSSGEKPLPQAEVNGHQPVRKRDPVGGSSSA